ncbi:Nuclease sbcCD subunit D [Dorea longicatena]|jgi:exonuclease SbcD|uniref:Nuclease SbcCD subunit D n=1 Tax=Dorea longicatena TaxID=88431 RepID=A0A173RZ88_9FIRM|nr:exonuclease SbcCD subunit D [Dorea longicatena]CUM82955.1 Nuclease sbcCD subunit D [Dorea longicatena]
MKFFHLSDLHIGKQLHRYNLKEDQQVILKEVITYAKELRPDAIVIAGDIYDKSVPSAEAVNVFDEFLTDLSEITPEIPILIISGNHDSPDRLKYASEILKRHHIYLAGNVPERPEEHIEKVTLHDVYGEVDFYLLPFMKPAYVKNIFVDGTPETYSDAVKEIIKREKIDYKDKRNVLVSHQFYVGEKAESPETCDSEVFSVGGIDNVDIGSVKEFDYVALGHLHGAQCIGKPEIRYCGTLLKYSVSESTQNKSLTVVTLKAKGEKPEIENYPLHPLRDVRKKKGTLDEIIKEAQETEKDDYISITLTDEIDPYKPKEQLERIFSHILEIRVDNQRTRTKLKEMDEELVMKDPFTSFAEFYKEMQGREMNGEEETIMKEIFDKAKGVE